MLDLTKLTDAVTKVASLAQAHAAAHDVASSAKDEATALRAEMAQAQIAIDGLAAQLIAAVETPAEAVGLAAVALAVSPATDAPIVPFASVAPQAPAPTATGVTYLPGDPRNTNA